MPRLSSKKIKCQNETMRSWIYGSLKAQNKTQRDLADILGVHCNTIGHKLQAMSFSYPELIQIFNYLDADRDTVIRLMNV